MWIWFKTLFGFEDPRVRDPEFLDVKHLKVSMELLSQYVVPQMGMNLANREELNIKLERLMKQLHSVNIPKQAAALGCDVYRDTLFAAQFMLERSYYIKLDDNGVSNF